MSSSADRPPAAALAAVVARSPGFGPANLPWGVYSTPGEPPRVGVALGDHVIDAARLLGDPSLAAPSLNGFLAGGPRRWRAARCAIQDAIEHRPHDVLACLVPVAATRLHLPIEVADFVDFFSSLEHATNAAAILRPGEPALQPNWRELPVGYHGRAGTVVVSGTPVVRPTGQVRAGDRSALRSTACLDFEAELGFVVGTGSAPGRSVPIADFAEHVFGIVLLIDWSARDLQAFEYRPLGPFLAKSFATTISPWVIPLDSLAATRVPPPRRQPEPLDYLREPESWSLDIDLQLRLQGQVIAEPNTAGLYWTGAQQLAHLTVNGAQLRTGDLYGSGTVSSFDPKRQGSLLELTRNGTTPLVMADGTRRSYLEDGDMLELHGQARGIDGGVVDFGTAIGRILPRPCT